VAGRIHAAKKRSVHRDRSAVGPQQVDPAYVAVENGLRDVGRIARQPEPVDHVRDGAGARPAHVQRKHADRRQVRYRTTGHEIGRPAARRR
jgi:hypothetical protein